jgi:hypothetical protein
MPTWKKIIVSGSQAHLVAVTASTAVLVGTNQQITTSPSTTFLSGSFSGSFSGDGSGLTGVTANFPVVAKTDLTTTDQFFINDGVNKFVTYGNLVLDLAGSGAGTSNLTTTDTGDSLALTSQIAVTGVTASFTGSLTGALIGTASWATNATTASNITPAITNNADNRVLTANGNGTINGESNLTFDGSLLTVTGDVAVNGATSADITTTTTAATVFNTNATTVNIAGAGTTVTIGAGTGNTTVNNNLTVTGDLTVNGATTIINTDNLLVEDKFVLLASGSTTNTDGGIVVQNAAGGTGSAIYWDGNDQRWAVNPAVAQNATSVAANSYIPTISGSSGNPSGNPTYGAADPSRIGAMYVNTADESIWIWS